MSKIINITITFLFIIVIACAPDEDDVEVAVYDPTPYSFTFPENFGDPELPKDNVLTKEGIKLGKMLFYEKALSKDGTQSCASCHVQSDGFSDKNQFSKGVDGILGNRQAMPIFNLAWRKTGFFWDGRAASLREQSLLPIQDPIEMHETLENVVGKLNADKKYANQFIRAFGTSEINSTKISLALEQFMMSIVSFDARYDQFLAGKLSLTESEERGRKLFFTEYNAFFPELSGADCAHCHTIPNFENAEFMNNGLDTDVNFKDFGREKVSNLASDRATFLIPSLRNIAQTAPYMHDGRFRTLEEVVEHYNSGVKMSSTVSPLILPTIAKGLRLDEQDKTDLVNFLKTLSDQNFLTNPAYAK
jgi:cytochrome c peroxidase